MRWITIMLVVGCCSASVYAGVDLKSDCTGFSGRSYENGVQLFFESCPTAESYHSRLWRRVGKSMETMTELDYDKKTKALDYRIGGILVTGSNTPSEEARMLSVLTSPESELARKLAGDLGDLGLTLDSPGMRGIRGNVVGYPELGLGVPQPAPDTTCGGGGSADCCAEESDCLGCCAYACFGCVACSTGCLIHDLCVRETGGLCIGWALVAIAQTVDPITSDTCMCP